MAPSRVQLALALALSSSAALAQLAAKDFTYTNLPYQADTSDGERGRQVGYNRCNSTTEGTDSLCQTATIVDVTDFCLWAPREPNSIVGDVEGSMVAWCTKEGRGTRHIPAGALTGVQFTKTPHYIQVVGWLDQAALNIQADDSGGEMDPHGADQRGNPLGGLLFSPSLGDELANGDTAPASSYQQVKQWHNFIGSGSFCLKACDPSYANDYALCEHIYDRIGCAYNAPADYEKIRGNFESCEGDDQLPPGQYVQNGRTLTYTQPPESLGAISTIPYVAAIPKSSNCVAYQSSDIYKIAAVAVPTTSAAPTTATSATSATETSATDTSATSATSAAESSSVAESSAASTQDTATLPSATGSVGETAAASSAPAATSASNTSGAVGASLVSSVALALVGGALIVAGLN